MASVFVANFRSYIGVSASGAPNYLLGNLSNSNLTAARASELSDKVANFTKTFLEKSGGNASKLNMLLLDEAVNRNIISEKDKQQLLSLLSALNQVKPTSNLTLVNNDISSRLENLANNSSSPVMVVMKNILKRNISCTPIIGINAKVCLPFSTANTTHTVFNNMTNGTSGIPSTAVYSRVVYDIWLGSICALGGGIAYGGIGAIEGVLYCPY
ncbi:MAG: hypothetical protein ACM3JQ_05105 [Candidatus Eiseniibacteriota bacterium]